MNEQLLEILDEMMKKATKLGLPFAYCQSQSEKINRMQVRENLYVFDSEVKAYFEAKLERTIAA